MTLVVALVTGAFGFLSGAAAAAYVTTRHERIEGFRDRMINTADEFVGKTMEGFEQLDNAEKLVRKLGSAVRSPARNAEKERAILRKLDQAVAASEEPLDELSRLTPRLYVVFRGPRVGLEGEQVQRYLEAWKEVIGEARGVTQGGGAKFRFDVDAETGEETAQEINPWQEIKAMHDGFLNSRNRLLKLFNGAIRRNWRL